MTKSPKDIKTLLEKVKTSFNEGKIDDAAEFLSNAAKKISEASDLSSCEKFLCEKFGQHLLSTGEIDIAVDSLDKLTQIHPWKADMHSQTLASLHYLPDIDQQTIFEEHKKWANINAPAENTENFHDNDPDPRRKLRIGYISPDFRLHPLAFLISPIICGHDRKNFEIYGYANVGKIEPTTEHIKSKCDFYRNIYGVDARQIVEIIKEDKIDILVELAGHANGNSLEVLAYKPAPIQVSYLGYPGTTGMTQIDYRFTDEILNPPQSQKFYTEELVYLPQPLACFSSTNIPVAPLPAEKNGFITFGAFQTNFKINSDVIRLWSKILNLNPASRLILRFAKGDEPNIRDFYFNRFEKFGIDRRRIEIGGRLSYSDHLHQYDKIDIALDTFPFNGQTTICEALWMGVPVISMTGDSFASRLGLDILQSVGLEFFAAKTADEYAAKAISLAQNLPSLSKIRASLRQRLLAGNLCNSKRLTSAVEDTYRKMWNKWCAEQKNADKKMISNENRSKKNESYLEVRQPTAKRGILYMIWGNNEKHEAMLQRSIDSVKKYHPELPIHIERLEAGGKINKTRICSITPFEETAFLDNDTIVLGSLDFAFGKAQKFGMACVINECPWARRYNDKKLTGDMVEYNSGVLFYTQKAKPLFDAWNKLFPITDASIIHILNGKKCMMPVADQGSFALAFEQTGFLPYVLPINWNFRPQYYKTCAGPIKIWHCSVDAPQSVYEWNQKQTARDSIIQFISFDAKCRKID
ncbi:MAG: hypothetical protein BWY69_01569 [Planctomycetes bacterium ADurb.Bin401]|nr:MAG: hypothetical protein BWY69_01569 [Planctomycetes bacterium ADurb.Bin401]